MIFLKYFNFLFLFLSALLEITRARIPVNTNSKREAPLSNVITEEVIETHSKNIVPVPNYGVPLQQPLPPVITGLVAPGPFPFGVNKLFQKPCTWWCRFRVFLNERDIITKEFFNRENAIKNVYGSQKIPGLFIYNSLLKRQKDIASRTNQLQKATELTAHLFTPLFKLLQVILPQFGPFVSPVLAGRLSPIPPPPPGSKGPLGEPGVIPKVNPIPLPQPILTPRGPFGEPVIIPKGSPFPLPQPILTPRGLPPPPPQPVVIPKGGSPHPAVLVPKGPLPQEPLPPRGLGPVPFQASGYFQNVVPTPQPLIGNRAHSETIATQVEKNATPIPAPPLPSPSPSALPIPPQPNFSIHPPPFIGEEISEVTVIAPTPLVRSFSSSPTPAPIKLSRGESGIVVTTVLPPSSYSSTTVPTSSPTTAPPTSSSTVLPTSTTSTPK